jgi:hypothetical protein
MFAARTAAAVIAIRAEIKPFAGNNQEFYRFRQITPNLHAQTPLGYSMIDVRFGSNLAGSVGYR